MKKVYATLLAIALLLTCIPMGAVSVSAATSGTTGNCTWMLNGTHLTISGNGAMGDYENPFDLPWCTANITTVTIGNGVTAIGEAAFLYCSSLESVIIPNSVTKIGDSAFDNCALLTTATIGNRVTTIGTRAFASCISLKSVTIPDSVTTIGNYAFSGCSSLTSVTIGDSVTSIGSSTFSCCTSLTSVTIPDSVTTIGGYAFEYCTSLTDVYYGGTEEDKANITIGTSNTSLLNATWHYEPEVPAGLLYKINDGEVTITGYTNELPADLVIPATIEGCPVTSIGEEAFYYCTSLTSVTIPDSVTSIGYRTFSYCASLTSVTIPDSVTSIGSYAFCKCTSLTSVTIPDSVTGIGDYAFNSCSSLTSVTIGDSVTSIGDYAFSGCDSLTSINVDQNSTKYCSVDGVLFNKDKTTLIQYPAGKTLTAYSIPDSVTSIGDQAFCSCDSLTSVTIPDSVTSIGRYAFEFCTSLTSVTIPDSVTSIGKDAFYYCSSLTDVYYGGSEEDKENITINSDNFSLRNATWHYADDPISDTVTHSVMDTANGNGLAFRFELSAKGVVKDAGNVMDLSNATVNYLGKDCKLIAMGAVLTNNAEVGATAFTLEDVNGDNVLNIPTVYLQEADEDSCAFATRIINIPITQLTCTIYARPYYIVEVDGEEITVYGEVDSATCVEYL